MKPRVSIVFLGKMLEKTTMQKANHILATMPDTLTQPDLTTASLVMNQEVLMKMEVIIVFLVGGQVLPIQAEGLTASSVMKQD